MRNEVRASYSENGIGGNARPHPVPLPLRGGEGARRAGEEEVHGQGEARTVPGIFTRFGVGIASWELTSAATRHEHFQHALIGTPNSASALHSSVSVRAIRGMVLAGAS